MRELEFDIITWDGEDSTTVEHCTFEEAWKEDFIEYDGAKLIPIDETVIIRQFTGLKDRNGTKVFEGDIVKFIDNNGDIETTEVYFDTELLEFGLKNTHGLFHAQFGEYFTKIGNIHE